MNNNLYVFNPSVRTTGGACCPSRESNNPKSEKEKIESPQTNYEVKRRRVVKKREDQLNDMDKLQRRLDFSQFEESSIFQLNKKKVTSLQNSPLLNEPVAPLRSRI